MAKPASRTEQIIGLSIIGGVVLLVCVVVGVLLFNGDDDPEPATPPTVEASPEPAPQPTDPQPEPEPTQGPEPEPTEVEQATDPRFGTCAEAIAAGYGPYERGVDEEYGWYRDGDGDGVTCER